MSENTMAISWPGMPSRERGDSRASKASVSCVGVVVRRMSMATSTATTRRSE